MDMMENGTSDAEIVQGSTAPVRSTATLAGIALEAMSAMRSQHDEQAADSDGRDSREITQRIEALRASSLSEVEAATPEGWIDQASPERIADLVQITDTWKGRDERMEAARQRIEQDVLERYGVRIADHPDRASIIDAISKNDSLNVTAALRDGQAEQRRDEAGQSMARVDELESTLDTAQSDKPGDAVLRERDENERGQAQDDAGMAFDSADRIQGEADRMRAEGVGEDEIQGRMLVEVSHGQSASQAPVAGRNAAARKGGKTASKARGVRKGGGNVLQQGLSQ
ncbi:hypothetical protein [Bifidobacterium aquikefiricola]|uniref:Uncharacterized protein n=1 Tax=Bifidobacterium aquikefiricola TaxID=3059038 RepID=A0AB39U5Z3_9BIFI